MFKDYDKYLSTSLKVYLFVLVIIFILKLVGLDYFGLDTNNAIILQLNDFCMKYHLDFVWFTLSLYIQQYLFLGIVCNKKRLYFYSLIGTIVTILVQSLLSKSDSANIYYFVFCILLFLIYPMIIERKVFFKRQIKCILLIIFYQFISTLIRNVNIKSSEWNFIIDTILNIDQLILLIITYKIKLLKGVQLCGQEVISSSLKKINLKNLQRKLQKNLHKFNKKEKVEKLTIIFYIILSLIWNTLSLVIILIVAKLNHTFIECIFILTSFWLSKRAFGKAFHLKSMVHCFIVSNLTYYALNRITTPLGISIFVPILLGVGLSYFTSKLVKKTYRPLYRGMPKDLFEETILKIVDKDSIKYKICYDFYIKNKSDLSLSFQYNYSIAGIRKIRTRINERIKKLE